MGSVPCSRDSPQSWTIPAGAEIRTHNFGLQVRLTLPIRAMPNANTFLISFPSKDSALSSMLEAYNDI